MNTENTKTPLIKQLARHNLHVSAPRHILPHLATVESTTSRNHPSRGLCIQKQLIHLRDVVDFNF